MSNNGTGPTWMEIGKELKTADEKKCVQLLHEEIKVYKRLPWILRIYGRFSRLRATRERNELIKKFKLPSTKTAWK